VSQSAACAAFDWLGGAIRRAARGDLTETEIRQWIAPSLRALSKPGILESLRTVAVRLADGPSEVVELTPRHLCARFPARGDADERTYWCSLGTGMTSPQIESLTFQLAPRRTEAPVDVSTDRLVLRRLDPDLDRAELAQHLADPRVMRLFGDGQTYDEQATDGALGGSASSWLIRGYGLWAIRGSSTSRLLGQIGLLHLADRGEIEVEFTLAPDVWGSGLATEAAHAVIAIALDQVGLERVVAMVHPENAASIRVLEKAGMRYERDEPRFGQPRRWYAIGNT
jgi:[ribosomal protein S5]-alanine N-acetyltransferase